MPQPLPVPLPLRRRRHARTRPAASAARLYPEWDVHKRPLPPGVVPGHRLPGRARPRRVGRRRRARRGPPPASGPPRARARRCCARRPDGDDLDVDALIDYAVDLARRPLPRREHLPRTAQAGPQPRRADPRRCLRLGDRDRPGGPLRPRAPAPGGRHPGRHPRRTRRPGRRLRLPVPGPLRRPPPGAQAVRAALRRRRTGPAQPARTGRLHPARGGHPPRRRSPEGRGRHAEPAAPGALRRVPLRRRLRIPLRRSRLRRALEELRADGVACLCLSIGASTPTDALERVFGSASHANATTLAELSPRMDELFLGALRELAVAQSRR